MSDRSQRISSHHQSRFVPLWIFCRERRPLWFLASCPACRSSQGEAWERLWNVVFDVSQKFTQKVITISQQYVRPRGLERAVKCFLVCTRTIVQKSCRNWGKLTQSWNGFKIWLKWKLEDLGVYDGVRYVLLLQGLTWIPPPITLIQLTWMTSFGKKTLICHGDPNYPPLVKIRHVS